MSAKRMLAWGRWLWGFWSASWQENPLVPNKPHQLRIRVHHHVSFHLLYRGTWFPTELKLLLFWTWPPGFHPLYRGTWYLTFKLVYSANDVFVKVSIRYIAVLGI